MVGWAGAKIVKLAEDGLVLVLPGRPRDPWQACFPQPNKGDDCVLQKKTVEMIDAKGKKVLVRCDFNVPLDKNQAITDDLRIRSALPTIEYLLSQGAAVILMSHLGRPKGQPDPEFSLRPVYDYLKSHLDCPVRFADDCVGPKVEEQAGQLQPGEVLLLENTRFHAGEEKNDPEMAKQLAKLADIYVNDAFGTAHRAHASTEGVAQHLPAVAGYLMVKELDYLANTVENPTRPFVAIIGGKKVSDKITVLKRLVEKCDSVLIGGGMAYTFFKAQGIAIGDSILDEPGIATAKEVMALADQLGKTLLLPTDVVAADAFAEDANTKVIPIAAGIPEGWQGLDVGPETLEAYKQLLSGSKTVVWNGPVGVFEMAKFAEGTKKLAEYLANSDATTIIGGGDTASAVEQFGYAGQMTHISTGGGASLELLEGKELPGVAILNDA